MNFLALFTYVMITAYTPGPNNIMAMTNSIKHGFFRALHFCFGALTGAFLVMTLCAVATSYLYKHIPAIESAMRWIGAAYIFCLAIVIFRDKGEAGMDKKALAPDSFITGVIMQLVNVKVILYGLTAFSTFIFPYHKSAGALTIAVVLLSFVSFSANICWAMFGSLFQNVYMKHRRPLNAVMAILLLYCAAGIVL